MADYECNNDNHDIGCQCPGLMGPARVDLPELVTLWLDGFGSGIATLAMKQLRCDAVRADEIAHSIIEQVQDDYNVMDSIVAEVKSTIFDKDRTTPNHTVNVKPKP